jgi:hypothetical protein
MIRDPQRHRNEDEQAWARFLRALTYEESVKRTEESLSSGLLEQIPPRRGDRPVALWHLLRRLSEETGSLES